MDDKELDPKTRDASDCEDRRLTALVLDDQAIDRMRLIDLCRKAGLNLKFSEAADIHEMRRLLDLGPFDIVFIDYHLGMETGLDALRILTSHEEQVRAIPIMVTSMGEHQVVVRAMRAGCLDYLVKDDLDLAEIQRAITSALERRILLAAISQERATRQLARLTIERFAATSAPKMVHILTGMLRRLRSLRSADGSAGDIADQLAELNGACGELIELVDAIRTDFDPAAARRPVEAQGAGAR
mgnify:CR=1 FL=1